MAQNMIGKVLGIAFSLLLLASLIQGLWNLDVIHNETLEAEVSQNISLPCLMKNVTGLNIVNVEWRKDKTKLGVYSPSYGHHYFWSNVTIQIEKTDTVVTGSYLLLPRVNTWDSGTYVCVIASYPLGSTKKETKLIVKDLSGISSPDAITLSCDPDGVIQVTHGENASIHCSVSSDAQYRWTKDERIVSENGSLELLWVTDAQAGMYKLTVETGDKTLHRNVTITVLRPDPVTALPQGLTDSAHSSFTTRQTTELSNPVNWITPLNLSYVTATDVENITSSTSSTPTSIPSSPDTHSSTDHSLNFTISSNATAVSSSSLETVSKETRNDSKLHTLQADDSFFVNIEDLGTVENTSEYSGHLPLTPTKSVKVLASENKGSRWTHLSVVLVIILLLLVIGVVCVLYWRQMKQKRMDLPPPFKPPPVPVKYTAARCNETLVQTFPASRCNSIAEPSHARQTYI